MGDLQSLCNSCGDFGEAVVPELPASSKLINHYAKKLLRNQNNPLVYFAGSVVTNTILDKKIAFAFFGIFLKIILVIYSVQVRGSAVQ